MDNGRNKLHVVLFMLCTFAIFFAMVGSKVYGIYREQNPVPVSEDPEAEEEEIPWMDWEEIYPYDTVVELVDSGVEEKGESVVDKITNELSRLSTIGNDLSKTLLYYDDIAKFGTVASTFLKDPAIGISYIKSKDGYWLNGEPNKIDLDSAKKAAVDYASLQKYLESKGINFLYFYVPQKMCSEDPRLPGGVNIYTNENIDTRLEAMDFYGIKYVDLRKNIHKQGLDHHAMYYKTDHHWTIETGLWASREIAREINKWYGYGLDETYNVDQYELVTFDKAEFGSEGWGVTNKLADPEDFTIPAPKFETDYRLEIPIYGIDWDGPYPEALVDLESLEEMSSMEGGPAYECVLFGNTPYTKITNLYNPDGIKIFMLRDSFACAVAPYLAELCSELVMVDVRTGPDDGNFNGSIINCINEFDPDIVITCQFEPHKLQLNKPE